MAFQRLWDKERSRSPKYMFSRNKRTTTSTVRQHVATSRPIAVVNSSYGRLRVSILQIGSNPWIFFISSLRNLSQSSSGKMYSDLQEGQCCRSLRPYSERMRRLVQARIRMSKTFTRPVQAHKTHSQGTISLGGHYFQHIYTPFTLQRTIYWQKVNAACKFQLLCRVKRVWVQLQRSIALVRLSTTTLFQRSAIHLRLLFEPLINPRMSVSKRLLNPSPVFETRVLAKCRHKCGAL